VNLVAVSLSFYVGFGAFIIGMIGLAVSVFNFARKIKR
jgi:hypothetical protein